MLATAAEEISAYLLTVIQHVLCRLINWRHEKLIFFIRNQTNFHQKNFRSIFSDHSLSTHALKWFDRSEKIAELQCSDCWRFARSQSLFPLRNIKIECNSLYIKSCRENFKNTNDLRLRRKQHVERRISDARSLNKTWSLSLYYVTWNKYTNIWDTQNWKLNKWKEKDSDHFNCLRKKFASSEILWLKIVQLQIHSIYFLFPPNHWFNVKFRSN